MNPASQYPQYPQMQNQMGYASGNKPLNPLENYPMMDPMGNSMIDPAMLQHWAASTAGTSKKQEDTWNMLRSYYESSFFPFSNDLLKDLMNQIDMYVQILIQTLLSTKDMNHQYQLYLMLYEFTKKKEEIMKPLNLPKFEVPWINPEKESGNSPGEPLKIQPQVSFYQTPILEYAYRIVKKIGK